ncbi:hypothetical protein GCM10023310_31370 [Paenibacillus vulneris]
MAGNEEAAKALSAFQNMRFKECSPQIFTSWGELCFVDLTRIIPIPYGIADHGE